MRAPVDPSLSKGRTARASASESAGSAGATGATDRVTAGQTLIDALKKADEPIKAAVGGAYENARSMTGGRAVDLERGMFIQTVMIACREFGLETCPQAAFANFHEIIRRRFSIPQEEMVICGMAIGYPDAKAKVNSFRTEREPVENYARFVETLVK